MNADQHRLTTLVSPHIEPSCPLFILLYLGRLICEIYEPPIPTGSFDSGDKG